MMYYDSHTSLQALQDQGAALCLTDSECGGLKTVADLAAFEHSVL